MVMTFFDAHKLRANNISVVALFIINAVMWRPLVFLVFFLDNTCMVFRHILSEETKWRLPGLSLL